ncbi:MAG TPA: glycosyltransferase family 9 protein [Thermomicrobiaceae bacterium]|nr:glycosyltransferase family 9 protein [Thermomicrobiaceae bacterium]
MPFVRDLVERSPWLDRFEPFPGFPGIAEQFFDARRATVFLQRMQVERFDLAVQLHGSGVSANPFTLLLGARATAGYVRPGDGAGHLDAALTLPETGHEVERALALPVFLGAPERGLRPEFPLLPPDHAAAEAALRGLPRPLVAVHPAAWDPGKRWPPEGFAAVAMALQSRWGGTALVVASAHERPAARAVAAGIRGRAVDLAGRVSLPVLGAVLARCAVVVTNDSGPAHVAYAVGAPSVTIFGDTEPARWGPIDGGPHAVVDGCGQVGRVTVEAVVAAAERVADLAGAPAVSAPAVALDLRDQPAR